MKHHQQAGQQTEKAEAKAQRFAERLRIMGFDPDELESGLGTVENIFDDPVDRRANQKQLAELKHWVKPPTLKKKNTTREKVNHGESQILD